MTNTEKIYTEIINFIRSYFAEANMKKAVIGISGGKDSTVTAKLLVDALGKENVFGVLMPNGIQPDIEDALEVVQLLDIGYAVINIYSMFNDFINKVPFDSEQMRINLAPRIRMTTLYAIAQGIGDALVINTCNLCEDIVGYATLYGDSAGDIAPLKYLLVSEIIDLGDYLGLPYKLVHKTPSDGLCGLSDEENLGVTYNDIECYITGTLGDDKVWDIIDEKYRKNKFKENYLPAPLKLRDRFPFFTRNK